MKVMIVDDDWMVCEGLKRVIPWTELDAELLGVASNGEDALRIAIAENPDLIISDIKMPIMDGLELCANIHRTMVDAHIILLSAHDEFEYARAAMKYGVRDFIVKPINRDKINQLISNMREISEKTKVKKSFYATYYNNDFEKEFGISLKNSDQQYFEHYFQETLPSLCLNISGTKELCIKLVNMLYDYVHEFGVHVDQCFPTKKDVLDMLYSKKTRHDIEIYVQQLYLDMVQMTRTKKSARVDATVDYVKRYIYENISDVNLSVASISDHLQLSASYVSAIFSQSARVNIKSYITDCRIKHACEVMADPAIKLTALCDAVGFEDPHYFSKVFKKAMGVTPTEYRNLKRSEAIQANP